MKSQHKVTSQHPESSVCPSEHPKSAESLPPTSQLNHRHHHVVNSFSTFVAHKSKPFAKGTDRSDGGSLDCPHQWLVDGNGNGMRCWQVEHFNCCRAAAYVQQQLRPLNKQAAGGCDRFFFLGGWGCPQPLRSAARKESTSCAYPQNALTNQICITNLSHPPVSASKDNPFGLTHATFTHRQGVNISVG